MRMIRLTCGGAPLWLSTDLIVYVRQATKAEEEEAGNNGNKRCVGTVDESQWFVEESSERIVQLIDNPDLLLEEEEQAKRDAESTWLLFISKIGVLAARTLNRIGVTTKEKLYEVARDGQTTRSRLSDNGRTRTKVIEWAATIFGQELP